MRTWQGILGAAAVLLTVVAARPEETTIPKNVESAVDRGLEWLAKYQEHDGSWTAGGNRGSRSAAVTGLAAMAFMARGHVPGQGPYGETLNRAIDYVLTVQQADGVLADSSLRQPMYDHGICTVMLCEAYGMLDERRQGLAMTAISRAVRLILNAQSVRKDPDEQGGWRYSPAAADSDISVTGWQLMALRGAANIGAAVPPRAVEQGIAYIKRRAVFGGGLSYMKNDDPNAARTGTGILALILLGQPDAPEVKQGAAYLLTRPPMEEGFYYYSIYYCSQAAWQLGGIYWRDISRQIIASLLKNQRANGSWSSQGGNETQGGDSYATAMSILALTVPYRYLPIYQR